MPKQRLVEIAMGLNWGTLIRLYLDSIPTLFRLYFDSVLTLFEFV